MDFSKRRAILRILAQFLCTENSVADERERDSTTSTSKMRAGVPASSTCFSSSVHAELMHAGGKMRNSRSRAQLVTEIRVRDRLHNPIRMALFSIVFRQTLVR
jgi:hypothetical protein